MGYVDSNLMPGEEIIVRAKLHWIAYGPALLALAGAIFVMTTEGAVFAAVLIPAAIIAGIFAKIERSSTEFAVTNKRIIGKKGLVKRSTHETSLAKMEALSVDQGILGRLLNYGTVLVTGTGGTPHPFARIAQPLDLRQAVFEQLDSSADSGPISVAIETTPTTSTSQADSLESLERLSKLRDSGALSLEEFEEQKQKFL